MPSHAPPIVDPAKLRERLLVDTDAGPRPLREVVDPWQRQDFEATDAAWRRIMGQRVEGARLRALLKRPRGHSKTSDAALMAAVALAVSGRSIHGVAAAGSRDQARLLRESIDRVVRLNPALERVLDVTADRVSNEATGSALRIVSSDAGTSWGANVQFILCDELCHWGDAGAELFESLLSAAAKRECFLLITTNAFLGAGSSWQWKFAEAARSDPRRWYVSELPGPVASWIDPDRLEEQRRLLPGKAYRRLWLNEDQADSGDLLDAEDLEAVTNRDLKPLAGRAFDLAPNLDWLPRMELVPPRGSARDVAPTPAAMVFVAGLDASIRRDHTALVIVGVQGGRYRLADVQHWAPTKGNDIDLDAVRLAVADAHRRFGLAGVLYDPHQLQFMAQMLRRSGVPMTETPFTAAACTGMATALLAAVRERQIELFPHPQLLADLRAVRIVETSTGGYRLDARRTAGGSHADCAVALALALLGGGQRVAASACGPLQLDQLFFARAEGAGSWQLTAPRLTHGGFRW